MPSELSVIVVTYNARDHVDRCLAAVFAEAEAGVDLEVLVVDSCSTDGTVAHVRAAWPAAKVLETGRNDGMAAGNNVGMLAAGGRAFLLLNADAFLHPGAIAALLQRLGAAPDTTAAVVPRLWNVDGSPQCSVRGFPTVWRYATEFWYLRRLAPRSRLLNAFYGGGLDLRATRTIDWATGACLLVPRAAVDDIGLMDEAYFMYGEEVDWLRRMRDHGRHVVWEPAAEATHVGGGSAKREWGRLYQVQLANHVRYMVLREGPRAARRTRRVLASALAVRWLAWHVASWLPGDRSVRRARAVAFRAGLATVRAASCETPTPARIPSWGVVERSSASDR